MCLWLKLKQSEEVFVWVWAQKLSLFWVQNSVSSSTCSVRMHIFHRGHCRCVTSQFLQRSQTRTCVCVFVTDSHRKTLVASHAPSSPPQRDWHQRKWFSLFSSAIHSLLYFQTLSLCNSWESANVARKARQRRICWFLSRGFISLSASRLLHFLNRGDK